MIRAWVRKLVLYPLKRKRVGGLQARERERDREREGGEREREREREGDGDYSLKIRSKRRGAEEGRGEMI